MNPFFCSLMLITTLIFSGPCFADFQAYQVAPCQFWMPGPQGGFVCQNIPPTILVPQARSIAKALTEQSDRIAELEKKLVELEAVCKRP